MEDGGLRTGGFGGTTDKHAEEQVREEGIHRTALTNPPTTNTGIMSVMASASNK